MEAIDSIPNKAGQICRITRPLEDENPADVYIITEDPSLYDLDDSIYVSNLKDLQRNQRQPLLTPQIAIVKGELSVIANSLEDYISSWNND